MENVKIAELRERIDQINEEMTKLFAERMEISRELAKHKKESKMAVVDKSREREVLSKVTQMVDKDLEGYVRILFSALFDLSKSYQTTATKAQSKLKEKIQSAIENTEKIFPTKASVACQGIEGAYSQLAADKLIPNGDIMYFGQFEGVFRAVEKGLCKYGILPIENSSYGSVNEVYDLMRKHHFYIVRSIKLHIGHTLLAKEGTELRDIEEIFSHEQAIGQCSEFLDALPNIKVVVCENTAVAAKLVAESESKNVAAISSKNCAELYGLSVVSDEIQSSENNYTRFICISKHMEIYPGAGKISLMLTTAHRPGALYEVISKFAALGVNLTKIESRPIAGKDFEFMFYFDLSASVYSESVLNLLSEFEAGPEQFVFLGSYNDN
ncbi:MAG: chorismate mutase [Oscillospiraceae bacterium]|jgi:chorismate mutase/prephenate dehydratase|nr:chorismate mutase [Oscillospiraceae bacterium]